MTTEIRTPQRQFIPERPTRERGATNPQRDARFNIDNIYWKKGPDEPEAGYIIVGYGLATHHADFWKSRGRIPLEEYSFTDATNRYGDRLTIEWNRDHLKEDGLYYWFFRNGGAHLFPIEQIVEMHWHTTPPYGLPKEVFPQLLEYDVPAPLWCPACPSPNQLNSEQELIQHAMIAHQLDYDHAESLVDSARRRPGFRSTKPEIQPKKSRIKVGADVAANATNSGFVCDVCGKSLKNAFGLAGHKRSHKAV